uniref:Olfactomedin-like domain-containing protein n=1 Tax=Amphilophus citrinellus TaxID=61819 RepID=A0A3Q0S8I7_AMPCI
GKCACELSNSERAFPHEKLRRAESSASACNSNITPQKVELESLLQGLEQRLAELHKDVQILEKEDDGELYGVLSLYVIENEMTEIKLLMDKLNSTTLGHQLLTANTSQQSQLENMKTEMEELEKFDSMQVIKGQQTIRSLTTDLDSCKRELGVLSDGKISLPLTRYNSKANFCHLDECYPYTDLDLATDESGVWVIFTTALDFGNIILSNVEEGDPPVLGKTWQTSLYKQAVTNTFMACGVLYATRYVSEEVEEIFYSFNTVTGKERFSVGIFINKVSPNIQALNYSPVDQMLYAYCDSIMVSYK